MQHALGAGIRLAIPPEFSLTPPSGVPSIGEEPTATDDGSFESTFDVRRECEVLKEECLDPEGANDGEGPSVENASGSGSDDARVRARSGVSRENRDPTSLEATIRRVCGAGDADEIVKYTGTGYPRDAVVFAVTVWGDDESKVIDFCEGFRRGIEMGIEGHVIAGALAACDNDVERAVASRVVAR
jgi:hypothetical protein